MHWTKDAAGRICRTPRRALHDVKVQPKGDGRIDTYAVFPRGGDRTIAGGIVNTLGGAKTICENFANRSGKM